MNWGTKITVLYLGFVALILTLVFTCLGHKTELEYPDYYAKEIKFQNQINAQQNAEALATPIEHEVMDKSVRVKVPAELNNADTKGQLHFLRPSDASMDQLIPLRLNTEGQQIVNSSEFAKGVYKMMISVSSGGKEYYKEAIINIK